MIEKAAAVLAGGIDHSTGKAALRHQPDERVVWSLIGKCDSIRLMEQSGFAGAMVDTARKNGGRPSRSYGYRRAQEVVDCARTPRPDRRACALKGSLSPPSPNYHFAEGKAGRSPNFGAVGVADVNGVGAPLRR